QPKEVIAMTATSPFAITDSSNALGRNGARLAAVQAIYQMDITGAGTDQVIKDFIAGRIGGVAMTEDPDALQERSVALPPFESGLFTVLVRVREDRAEDIEGMIKSALSAEWPYERLELTLRAILRSGVAELLSCTDIPAAATVSEYIDIAHAFY